MISAADLKSLQRRKGIILQLEKMKYRRDHLYGQDSLAESGREQLLYEFWLSI